MSAHKPTQHIEDRALADAALARLRCPLSGEKVHRDGSILVSESGKHKYPVRGSNIPLFAQEFCSEAARTQQEHYERITQDYVADLAYPHTEKYMAYLDGVFLKAIGDGDLGDIAEICCGPGEALRLLEGRIRTGVGVDASLKMLEVAAGAISNENMIFVQGDATILPLADGQFDNVVMFGGIHHVPNREGLFR